MWRARSADIILAVNHMPEIDMRNNPWNAGIPMDAATVARDIYLLLAIFSASKEICLRRKDGNDEGSVYGYSIRGFELTEVGRLLVSLAATCRNDWDFRSQSIDDALTACAESPEVGVLVNDLAHPRTSSLLVRDSWHKILHCHTMNFQRSEGPSMYSGYLEPYVHLYGAYQGKNRKASIDIYRWCEVVHALT
jgi:hypothetical protein